MMITSTDDPSSIWLKENRERTGHFAAHSISPSLPRIIKVYFRRLNAKKVVMTQRDEEFVFPVADSAAKLSGRDHEFQELALRRNLPSRERISAENLKAIGKSFNLKKQKMTKESIRIFGLMQKLGKDFYTIQENSLIVIILNREFNCTC